MINTKKQKNILVSVIIISIVLISFLIAISLKNKRNHASYSSLSKAYMYSMYTKNIYKLKDCFYPEDMKEFEKYWDNKKIKNYLNTMNWIHKNNFGYSWTDELKIECTNTIGNIYYITVYIGDKGYANLAIQKIDDKYYLAYTELSNLIDIIYLMS